MPLVSKGHFDAVRKALNGGKQKMTDVRNGTRVNGKAPHELLPGEYGKWTEDGNYYGVPPGTDLCANLASHKIEEHEDGTITVSPSILVRGAPGESWHGYLVRGDWRVC